MLYVHSDWKEVPVRLNVKGAKRDQLRREHYEAIAERDKVVAGKPLKQYYPCYNQGKHVSRKIDTLKGGSRRRVNIALSNARYEHEPVILDDPSTAITRVFGTARAHVTCLT